MFVQRTENLFIIFSASEKDASNRAEVVNKAGEARCSS